MNETLAIVLGSAAVGALASSIVSGLYSWRIKKAELERQDMEMAVRLTELRHQQLVSMVEWKFKLRQPIKTKVWDPLTTTIAYRRGLDEFRETGKWVGGETYEPPDVVATGSE